MCYDVPHASRFRFGTPTAEFSQAAGAEWRTRRRDERNAHRAEDILAYRHSPNERQRQRRARIRFERLNKEKAPPERGRDLPRTRRP